MIESLVTSFFNVGAGTNLAAIKITAKMPTTTNTDNIKIYIISFLG